jgi:outer membrane murein-binding lipoprotein Lpp
MRLIVIAIALAGLSLAGCGPVGAAKRAEPRTVTLEQKIDRLTALVEALDAARVKDRQDMVNFEACVQKCADAYPWLDPETHGPELPETADGRAACYEKCEKIKPAGVLGC